MGQRSTARKQQAKKKQSAEVQIRALTKSTMLIGWPHAAHHHKRHRGASFVGAARTGGEAPRSSQRSHVRLSAYYRIASLGRQGQPCLLAPIGSCIMSAHTRVTHHTSHLESHIVHHNMSHTTHTLTQGAAHPHPQIRKVAGWPAAPAAAPALCSVACTAHGQPRAARCGWYRCASAPARRAP